MTKAQKNILVTGAAGFIGMQTARRLLDRGDTVVGLDNLNDYYSPQLKLDRLAEISGRNGFHFEKLSLEDRAGMEKLFQTHKFDSVIHLAAQAGELHFLSIGGREVNFRGYIANVEAGFGLVGQLLGRCFFLAGRGKTHGNKRCQGEDKKADGG